MVARAIYRTALKSGSRGGNVSALVTWVGEVGFDAAVSKLKDQVDPKTGQPYGEERAKRIVGKLKGMANRRGQLRPEHSYDPAERAAAKAWSWRDILKAAKGEGSRGGHVIGHTKSGKPIYARFDHPAHARFARGEHLEAAEAHRGVVRTLRASPMGAAAQRRAYHHDVQAERHLRRAPRVSAIPDGPVPGAWERVVAAPAVQVRVPDAWRRLHPKPLEAVARAEMARIARTGAVAKHHELGDVRFSRTSVEESLHKEPKSPEELLLVPDLPRLVSRAHRLATEPPRDQDGNTRAYHRLAVKVALPGERSFVTDFVVREDQNGQFFYVYRRRVDVRKSNGASLLAQPEERVLRHAVASSPVDEATGLRFSKLAPTGTVPHGRATLNPPRPRLKARVRGCAPGNSRSVRTVLALKARRGDSGELAPLLGTTGRGHPVPAGPAAAKYRDADHLDAATRHARAAALHAEHHRVHCEASDRDGDWRRSEQLYEEAARHQTLHDHHHDLVRLHLTAAGKAANARLTFDDGKPALSPCEPATDAEREAAKAELAKRSGKLPAQLTDRERQAYARIAAGGEP